MTRKRRGDDAPTEAPQAEPEVPASDNGFPVSAAPAPEEAGDEPATDPADGASTEGDDAVADGPATDAPLLKVNFTFHREFRKHVHTGTIVAIELVNGALQGVRECSRPEEQVHGALPVMQLEDRDSDVGKWYRAESLNFRPWTPPEPPKVLMDALMKLYEESVEVRAVLEAAKTRLKHAAAAVKDVDERVFHMLRRIHEVPDAQLNLPLPAAEPGLPLEDADGDGVTDQPLTAAQASLAQALDEVNEEGDVHSLDEEEPEEDGDDKDEDE